MAGYIQTAASGVYVWIACCGLFDWVIYRWVHFNLSLFVSKNHDTKNKKQLFPVRNANNLNTRVLSKISCKKFQVYITIKINKSVTLNAKMRISWVVFIWIRYLGFFFQPSMLTLLDSKIGQIIKYSPKLYVLMFQFHRSE